MTRHCIRQLTRALVVVALLPTARIVAAQTPAPTPDPGASASNDQRPPADERFRRYLNATAGPLAIGESLGLAALAQMRDSPTEWTKDRVGYEKRLASVIAHSAVEQTVMYALAEALRVDTRFHKSGKHGFFPRAGDALMQAFVSRRADGRRVLSVPLLAGDTVGGLAMLSWYPGRYTAADGMGVAGLSISTRAGVNLFREFVRSR